MLTCVHFNAGVLGKGGGFPNAYLNKSDRTGTTQPGSPMSDSSLLPTPGPLLKGPRGKK